MTDPDRRECQCRQCKGVLAAADAVQYVWEFSLGSCAVPIVVGVNAQANGWVTCANVYWWDEPNDPHPIGELGEFLVSCRPGSGTTPTEGDVARWMRWSASARPPRDWLLVDGLRYRSVRATAEALRQRQALPEDQLIPGDGDEDLIGSNWREEIRVEWAQIKSRNRARWRV